jgi:hypothetical protein
MRKSAYLLGTCGQIIKEDKYTSGLCGDPNPNPHTFEEYFIKIRILLYNIVLK